MWYRAGRHPCWSTGPTGGYTVGNGEGYTGYRGIPTHRPRAEEQTHDSGAGPVRPCRGLEWVVMGLGRPFACTCRCVRPDPAPTLRARSVPEAPPWGRVWAPRAKGRDSTSFLLNLVKRAECHQNMLIRPVIVPVSKTASEYHLLIFWDFRFP